MAKTAGRRKIELKIIENQKSRAVTLSKRHDGLFKKAGELATLCGAQIVIILFTVCGKPLTFGSPSVSSVLTKFLNSNHGDDEADAIQAAVNSLRKAEIDKFNKEFNKVNEKSATVTKRGQALQEYLKAFLSGNTYEDYKNNIEIDKLVQIKCKLEQLKRELQYGCYAGSGSSSFKNEYEADLSKIEGPRDYLKL